jgi:hypothetical protein
MPLWFVPVWCFYLEIQTLKLLVLEGLFSCLRLPCFGYFVKPLYYEVVNLNLLWLLSTWTTCTIQRPPEYELTFYRINLSIPVNREAEFTDSIKNLFLCASHCPCIIWVLLLIYRGCCGWLCFILVLRCFGVY